jgi:hypothetical protein
MEMSTLGFLSLSLDGGGEYCGYAHAALLRIYAKISISLEAQVLPHAWFPMMSHHV